MLASQPIRVEQGLLQGTDAGDGVVASFKGVPFAKPPVGELRWRAPQRPEPWEGVRSAASFGPNPEQMRIPVRDRLIGGDGTYGELSEDCLHLNVWTGAGDATERRPVMVWLYQGGFAFGGAGVPMYNGEALARDGAVVVTVNYRVGRLGFLAHPELSAESEHGASGHYGLLDQIRALEWIQENIAAFGGDPGCVTVFGHSAGGHSVNLLMAAPPAKGLFHRGIAQSGAMMTPAGKTTGYYFDQMQDLESAEKTGLLLAKELGCTSVEELRRRSPADIIGVPALKLHTDPRASGRVPQGSWLPFGTFDSNWPAIDGYVQPSAPVDIFNAGNQADVPLLTGSTAREYAGPARADDLEAWRADARELYGEFADRFLEAFPATEETLADVAGAAGSDRVFVWQPWKLLRAHVATAQSKAFYYHWTHEPLPSTSGNRPEGAYHGVELPYVFQNFGVYDEDPWSDDDQSLQATVSSYWLNFARTGDPNGEGLPTWSAFDPDAPQAMHIGDSVEMGPVPRLEQLAFWDEWYAAMPSSTPTANAAG